MNDPIISIICCARNGGAHLPALRTHLLAAMRPDYEVVLVDDASTDDTGELFDRLAAEVPAARVLHRPESTGVGEAQIAAVAAARGEFVWLIDCDDRFPVDGPALLLTAAERTGADVVVARAESVDLHGHAGALIDGADAPALLTSREALERMLAGRIEGYTWTKLLRRSLFDEHRYADGAAPPPITTQSDFCRIATALARSERVAVIPDVVYIYVRHGASLMDRREPPLENLAVARDHLVRLIEAVVPPSAARRQAIARFTTWFLAASAVQIPFYVAGGPASRRTGRHVARAGIRTVRVADVLAVDRLLGVEAVLLRLSPLLYEGVFRLTHRRTAARPAKR